MPTKKVSVEQELDVLFPEQFHQTQAGEKIVVNPFAFGFWRTAIGIYNRNAELIQGAMQGEDIAPLLLEDDGAVFEDLAALTLGACPGFTRENLDKLPGNEAILLFFAVVKVNADFFARSLAAGLKEVSLKSSPA